MDTQYQIKNVTQWLALPEIEIPKLKNPNEKGKVYDVKNVGFFIADIKQCSALNITGLTRLIIDNQPLHIEC
jgi:hypothetical protein